MGYTPEIFDVVEIPDTPPRLGLVGEVNHELQYVLIYYLNVARDALCCRNIPLQDAGEVLTFVRKAENCPTCRKAIHTFLPVDQPCPNSERMDAMSDEYIPEVNDIVTVPGLPDGEAIVGKIEGEKTFLFYQSQEVDTMAMLAIHTEETPHVVRFIRKAEICQQCQKPEWVYMPAGLRCKDYFERTFQS